MLIYYAFIKSNLFKVCVVVKPSGMNSDQDMRHHKLKKSI